MPTRQELARRELARRELEKREFKFLPGRQRTEELISKRKPALDILKEEIAYRPKTGLEATFKIPTLALKGAGLVKERAEAAIAEPLIGAQGITARMPEFIPPHLLSREEQKKQGIARTKAGLAEVGRAGKAFVKGITGERRTQFGDVPRRAGFPEPISAFIGLGTSLAIVDPLINRAITKTLSRAGKGIKDLFTGERKKVLDGVKNFVGGVDDYVDDVGNNVGKIWTGNNKIVPSPVIKDAIDDLPQAVLRRLKSKDARKLFKIKFNEKGQLVPTKENMWRVRRFLDDYITPTEFQQGATKVAKQNIFKARTKLRDALLVGEPEQAAKVMDNYSTFFDDWGFVKTTVTEKGRPVANKVIQLFTRTGEPAKKEAMQRIADIVPRGKDVINRALEYNKAQTALKVGAGVVGGGLLLGARRKAAEPVEIITGGGGGIQQ